MTFLVEKDWVQMKRVGYTKLSTEQIDSVCKVNAAACHDNPLELCLQHICGDDLSCSVPASKTSKTSITSITSSIFYHIIIAAFVSGTLIGGTLRSFFVG